MKTRAAVAFEAKKPLELLEIDLEGPQEGEVLVEIKATGICHTDAYTLSGKDPEGLFPSIMGHEGAGIVQEVGKNVKGLKQGDHVIPLYTPECRECDYCLNPKTNLCQSIRTTQGQGLMPNGTSRFSYKGKTIYHYMGTSTFSNFTVLPEIALAKINPSAPFDKVCYVGCGVTTGIGAVINTAKAEAGCRAVVFGLGGIGLNVIQGLKLVGAEMIDTTNNNHRYNTFWSTTSDDNEVFTISRPMDFTVNSAGVPTSNDYTADLKSKTKSDIAVTSVYFQDQIDVSDNLKVMIGGRHDTCLLYTSPSPRDRG